MMAFFTKKKLAMPNKEGWLPCLSGTIILQREFQHAIQEITQSISVPPLLYQAIYITTLNNVAEYCQSMPINQQAEQYSLLNWQLRLSAYMLKLRRGLLLPQNSTAEKMAEQDPIWTYAFFTVGLLFQLHRIQHDRHIQFCGSDKHKKLWHPLLGSFYQDKSYYSIEWSKHHCLPSHTVASILIHTLIPKSAIDWIVSTPEVFVPWWQTIINDERNNILSEMLYKAVNLVNYPLFKSTVEGSHRPTVINSIADDENSHSNQNETLNSLLLWIKENHQQQDIIKVTNGLFITTELLNKYSDTKNYCENALELINRINIFLVAENDNYLISLRSIDLEDRHKLDGIVVKDAYLHDCFKKLPINKEFIPDYSL